MVKRSVFRRNSLMQPIVQSMVCQIMPNDSFVFARRHWNLKDAIIQGLQFWKDSWTNFPVARKIIKTPKVTFPHGSWRSRVIDTLAGIGNVPGNEAEQ